MSFISKLSCFSIGILFSGGLTFNILESIRDRRCLFVKDNNDKIKQLIYTAKLKELLYNAELKQYRMSELETQLVEKSRTLSRFLLLNFQTVCIYIHYFIQ